VGLCPGKEETLALFPAENPGGVLSDPPKPSPVPAAGGRAGLGSYLACP